MSSHFGPAVKSDCLQHPTTTHCKNYLYIRFHVSSVQRLICSILWCCTCTDFPPCFNAFKHVPLDHV